MIPLVALQIPLVDDLLSWAEYQVRTMDDSTFALMVAGLVLVLALVMMGIRPKY